MSIHLDIIPNRNSPPAILLREAHREGRKIKRTTLCNLSKAPPALIQSIRILLKGGVAFQTLEQAVTLCRSHPHGHVAAILGTLRKIGLLRILGRKAGQHRSLAVAAILARIIDPASRLATARALSSESAATSLGQVLDLGHVTGNEMLDMLDWLAGRQPWIERSLAKRHLDRENTLILHDVISSHVEGRCCPLAAFGCNRDEKKGRQQIVYGLLCVQDGCPIAVEAFAGNAADPNTVFSQVQRIRKRFQVQHVALVGDWGMLPTARIREDLQPSGFDWISALTHKQIRKLLTRPNAPAALDPELLIPDQVAEVISPEFPHERLMVCLNPRLRQERRRKREALLQATEQLLETIAQSVKRGTLKGQQAINRRAGREASRKKVQKPFEIAVTDDRISWQRRAENIAAEAQLDGVYVIRTGLDASSLGAEQAVAACKSLSQVEQAFRNIKTSRLKVRPIYVYTTGHVKAHVFLCMLAFHVEWHMRRRLAPLLFEDDQPEVARAQRNSPIEPAEASPSAKARASTRKTPDGLPVHSLSTLLAELATLTRNQVSLPSNPDQTFTLLAKPAPLQTRAFELLEIDLP
ncbi:MAG: IS1634 family transposase [Gammaproteobacteria bacterium]|nr:IS1634 family transposase [Gammaproteobacteria bacterium]